MATAGSRDRWNEYSHRRLAGLVARRPLGDHVRGRHSFARARTVDGFSRRMEHARCRRKGVEFLALPCLPPGRRPDHFEASAQLGRVDLARRRLVVDVWQLTGFLPPLWAGEARLGTLPGVATRAEPMAVGAGGGAFRRL